MPAPNVNTKTGVRFGVIAVNSLDPDVVHELFYGPDAKDLSYEEAYAEAKSEAEKEHYELFKQAQEPGTDIEEWFQKFRTPPTSTAASTWTATCAIPSRKAGCPRAPR